MAFGDATEDSTEALRSFEDAVLAATDALEGMSQGGGGGTGEGRGGRSRRRGGALGGFGGSAGGFAQGGANAAVSGFAGGFGVDADLGSGVSGAARGAASYLADIPVIGALFGIKAGSEVINNTISGVSGITEQFARFGIDVSDDERQRLIDLTLEQEKNVQRERSRVAEQAGGADQFDKALKDTPLGDAIDLVKDIRDMLREVKLSVEQFGSGGGAPR